MKIIVIDIESTCWLGKPPEGQRNEIIEMGLCDFDTSTMARINKTSLIVKPQQSVISKFCTQLTSLTQEDVNKGMSLSEACRIIAEEHRSRVWGSYGNYDREKIQEECALKNIKYPLGPSHFNIKTMFGIAYNLPKEVGLKKALDLIDIPFEGTHHRGADDAWNIAKILSVLIKRLQKKGE